jgi:hypothetical protein
MRTDQHSFCIPEDLSVPRRAGLKAKVEIEGFTIEGSEI